MSYAEEILKDAENWITVRDFKAFWESQGIVLGINKLRKTVTEISKLNNATYYIRDFGSIKNRRIHKIRVLNYISGERL